MCKCVFLCAVMYGVNLGAADTDTNVPSTPKLTTKSSPASHRRRPSQIGRIQAIEKRLEPATIDNPVHSISNDKRYQRRSLPPTASPIKPRATTSAVPKGQ